MMFVFPLNIVHSTPLYEIIKLILLFRNEPRLLSMTFSLSGLSKTVRFRYCRMYGALADSEFFRRRPHGRACLYDVSRQITGAFLDVGFQKHHSTLGDNLLGLYAARRGVMILRDTTIYLSKTDTMFYLDKTAFFIYNTNRICNFAARLLQNEQYAQIAARRNRDDRYIKT
jgi:hypothetical protein